MNPGTPAANPVATAAMLRYPPTVQRLGRPSRRPIRSATAQPYRNAIGNATSIGCSGWPLNCARLFMETCSPGYCETPDAGREPAESFSDPNDLRRPSVAPNLQGRKAHDVLLGPPARLAPLAAGRRPRLIRDRIARAPRTGRGTPAAKCDLRRGRPMAGAGFWPC